MNKQLEDIGGASHYMDDGSNMWPASSLLSRPFSHRPGGTDYPEYAVLSRSTLEEGGTSEEVGSFLHTFVLSVARWAPGARDRPLVIVGPICHPLRWGPMGYTKWYT